MKKALFVLSLITFIVLSFLLDFLISRYTIALPKFENQANSETLTISTAAVNLPAKIKESQYGKDFNPKIVLSPASIDGFITEIEPIVTNAAARNVLHHASLGDAGQKDPTCSNFNYLLAASGGEASKLSLPEGYGIPVRKNTLFYLYAHLRNDSEVSYKNVVVSFRLKVDKSKNLKGVKPLIFFTLPCREDPSYPVPENTSEYKTSMPQDYIAKESGKFVFLISHLHKGGSGLELVKNDELIWSSKPILDKNQNIGTIKPALSPNLGFKKGDKLNIVSTYQNNSSLPIDAMGGFLSYYEPL